MDTLKQEKKSNIIKIGIILFIFIGVISILMIFKPYGDKFPFDDLFYKTSKKTGLEYRIIKMGDKGKLKDTDWAFVNFAYRPKKSIKYIASTKKQKILMPFQFEKSMIKKNGGSTSFINEALSKIRTNGIINVKTNIKNLFKTPDGKPSQGMDMFIKKNNLKENSEIIFEIELKEIKTDENYKKEEEEKREKQLKEYRAKIENRFKQEKEIIASEIKKFKEKHPNTKILKIQDESGKDSGIRYYRLNNGVGRKLKKGDRIEVEYSLYIDDKLIGTEKSKIELKIASKPSEVIKGWDLILQQMRFGESIKIWIPSKLGYGPRGTYDGSIKPDSILHYKMKVTNLFLPSKL